MGDGRVAELEQVPGREGRTGELVDGDDRQGVRRTGLDRHEREVAGEGDQRLAGALQRGDDEDAVHAQACAAARRR